MTSSLTVRELAKRWRRRPAFIRDLIRRGLLAAADLNAGLGGRSAIRITREAVLDFEKAAAAAKPKPVRRRKAAEKTYY